MRSSSSRGLSAPTFPHRLFVWGGAMLILSGMSLGRSAYANDTTYAEPSGASLAFTAAEPAIVRARQLLEQGKLSEAESTLPSFGDASQPALEMREIIRRFRIDYSLSPNDLVEKLKPFIHD